MNISALCSATNRVGWPSLSAVLFGFTRAASLLRRSKIPDVIESARWGLSGFKSNLYIVQTGFRLLAAAIAIGGVPAEAAAQHPKHVAHHRKWGIKAAEAQAELPESGPPDAMRYYGGPKSPMWRAVP